MRTPVAVRFMTAEIPATADGSLPNFLLIGAMKAGTTSLYHYLRSHPQVFMPAFKAPEFFAAGSQPKRSVEWYRKQFAGATPESVAVGEASNVYTKFPQYPGVPKRIAELIPGMRLIYIVRNPIERIRSHYQTRVAEGSEPLGFEAAVSANPIYVDYSRYALQIEQYMEHFPRQQLLVVTSEDLRHARESVMRCAYEFLQVDAGFVPADLDREFYRTREKPARSLVPLRLRKSLKQRAPRTKRFKEMEANIVRRLNRFRGTKPGAQSAAALTVPDAMRRRLEVLLADDVRELRKYLGADFDGWGIA